MQNVGQSENRNIDKVNVQLDVVKTSTPQSSASSPAKSETETYSGAPAKYMTDSSESEDDSVSEAEMEEEGAGAESTKFLLAHDDSERTVDPEMQARLEALLEAAECSSGGRTPCRVRLGIGKLSGEGKHLTDPEVLRRLTSSVSCALDEAAAALTRMRSDQPPAIAHPARLQLLDKPTQCGSTATGTTTTVAVPVGADGAMSLVEACSDGDVGTVRKLLTEGRSVHETTEEGESLLSLACSAGYYELAQVLLAMHASVEDRGIKGDCTPLMEAASAGHVDIVHLLVAHSADVNAVSGSGNTPLMYACAGGHEDCVRALLDHGANVEDHNENGHTPLMEAASAGHVGVAKILLEHGAGINTHSNEFKESALTLACYKGHLDMVRFLLAAGADREHKTDEMHTALMEASMDGHVEVARLLLDSGAQVNMPTDSFESPLTLAACGGHVELAMLLLERGANIEEVNDEGYTPLMEAAREGHEEMVALLLGQGAAINAQTDETQETALTLACCGGFLEVADFLIKAGADVEAGASTPLMEASQEGHLELVRYLLNAGADVHAHTQTCDSALTYACENGHTDVGDLLLRAGALLEHESEGGRTPLMKACRAGHVCTVQYLVGKGADVNRLTANGDHTPLSLACAGGHADVVKFLLACDADPFRKLKDNSTTLIEAAKGGHTAVVQLLLDYPHSVMLPRGNATPSTDDGSGLSAAQAAALGLSHAAAPGAPQQRTLLPAHTAPAPAPAPAHQHPHAMPTPAHAPQDLPANFAKVYVDGRKKQTTTNSSSSSGATAAPAPPPAAALAAPPMLAPPPGLALPPGMSAPPGFTVPPGMTPPPGLTAPGTKHKCVRKQRAAPTHSDHHLPPPPDILDEQICHDGNTKLSLPPGFTWNDVVNKNGHHKKINQELNSMNLDMREASKWYKRGVRDAKRLLPRSPEVEDITNLYSVVSRRPDVFAAPIRTEALPQTERNLLELADATGPPTLATSALHALDLQFCAQGVTTIHPPTTPPYPPPQQLFSVQQLATNLTQHQLELQKQTFQQLAAQQQQQHRQQQYVQEMQRPETYATQSVEEAALGAGPEARELGAVLAYLQREVPSLVALPPNELRALVLQVMQQKSHEILAATVGPELGVDTETGAAADERRARRLLAAAGEAIAADWPAEQEQQHAELAASSACQYRSPRPPSPVTTTTPAAKFAAGVAAGVAAGLATLRDNAVQTPPDTRHFAHQTQPAGQTTPFEDYRPPAFAPPVSVAGAATGAVAGAGVGAATQTLTPPLAPPHAKREQPHHHTASTAAKKKGRFGLGRGRGGAGSGSGAGGGDGAGTPPAPAPAAYSAMDVDGETDSNRDTALTLACAGGHEELVELLLSRGADIEHRDKKGFTPLILAATAGHEKIVEVLLNHGADIEAQSERTKDTPLSLACSGGRYEVVELILSRGANKEHRNVSDYTPLSLAASGGYVNIIRLLLHHQAEINSRTGSKLGISPLMLAAMNGHTAAVRLLLDCGSDINAQIETNRNTALTLACFQGRHEVVSLLLDRKANVEHRAKTGLTPLMEAASGGYVEVGRVLLDKGADVNAPPVPSSRDTALTIAADKGHTKFVELLLQRRAAVEVKNKKGNSPLWLAANGGHLAVVEMLFAAGADIDSQDNRKVSCLMAAFRKGHTKVVKWMVGVVTQFPSDQEMTRYICTINDKELLEKCQECVRVIRAAKETQAARANQNATILLEELDAERCREESRRQAAARRRERKKKKKMEKKVKPTSTEPQEERRKLQEENDKNTMYCEKALGECSETGEADDEPVAKEEGDSGIDANSQGSCSSSDVKAPPAANAKCKKKKKDEKPASPIAPTAKKQPDKIKPKADTKSEKETTPKPVPDKKQEKENVAPTSPPATPVKPAPPPAPAPALGPERREKKDKKPEEDIQSITVHNIKYASTRKSQVFESTRLHLNVDKDDVDTGTDKIKKHSVHQWDADGKSTSPKGGCVGGRREEGWKEVVRKSSVQTLSTVEPGCKKVSVASHAISRVIGRAGSNINAIRSATGAHIEVDKQSKGQGERIITIKGSGDATKQAAALIAAMIRDPEADIAQLLPRAKLPAPPPPPAQPKPTKQQPTKAASASASNGCGRAAVSSRAAAKPHAAARVAAPRLQAHGTLAEKRAASSAAAAAVAASAASAGAKPGALSYTGAIVGARSHTFAAKLTAPADTKPRPAQPSPSPLSVAPMPTASPLKARESPPAAPAAAPAEPEPRARTHEALLSPDNSSASGSSWNTATNEDVANAAALHINTTTQQPSGGSGTQEYSLFKDLSAGGGMWGAAGEPHHNVEPPQQQVDASKAPGYRGGGGAPSGGGCSPCSRTSSHGSTPPPAYAPPATQQPQTTYHQPMPIGNNVNQMDMSGLSRNGPIYQDNSRNGHNMMPVSMSGGVSLSGGALGLGYVGAGAGVGGGAGVETVSRLNPRAPDFAQRHPHMQQQTKHTAQMFASTTSAGSLSTLLMSYQQPAPKPMQHNTQQHHPYQSLLDRGVSVGVNSVGGWGEEEERKPRPIGTERAWKMTGGEDWPHHHHHHMQEHDRYQGMSGVGVGHAGSGPGLDGYGSSVAGASSATAAALSLMHALPLHYLPPAAAPEPPPHWERAQHSNEKQQTWSKWSH